MVTLLKFSSSRVEEEAEGGALMQGWEVLDTQQLGGVLGNRSLVCPVFEEGRLCLIAGALNQQNMLLGIC